MPFVRLTATAGPAGPDGPQGPAGPDGPQGAAGTDGANVVALSEIVDGVTAARALGAVSLSGGDYLLAVGSVSAAGLTLTVRLYDLTLDAWASVALAFSDHEAHQTLSGVATIVAGNLYRVHMTLSGGAGTDDEFGFLGSASVGTA